MQGWESHGKYFDDVTGVHHAKATGEEDGDD
jgi:hypothetical protein